MLLLYHLDCNAEIIKLRLGDAEEAECEAGVELGEGQPAGVRHVVAGVHPLAGGLRGVRVEVDQLEEEEEEEEEVYLRDDNLGHS